MKILIADDDPCSLIYLQSTLENWGYQVVTAIDGAAANALLQQIDAPELVILDWMMPGMDGIDICRMLRNPPRDHYTYVIMLTARSELNHIVEAMNAGADDFLSKPFNMEELQVRLRAGTRIIDLQQELRQKATFDALTGVYNRGAIIDIFDREMARHKRDKNPLSIIFADLDHFKKINDRYGHLAGDAVLCEVTRRIASALRSYDSIGRYGGEEILLILPACSVHAAAEVAERVRHIISASAIKTEFGAIATSISIGVTMLAPNEEISGKSLLQRADEALYRAKNNGRDRVEIA